MNSSTYQQRILQALLFVSSILYFSAPIYSLTLIYSHGTEDTTSLIQEFLWIMSDALLWLLLIKMVMAMKNPAVVEALDLCLCSLIVLFQFITVFTISLLKRKNSLHRKTEIWAYILLDLASSFAVYYLTYSTEQRIKTEMKKKEENGVELDVPLLEQKESYVV